MPVINLSWILLQTSDSDISIVGDHMIGKNYFNQSVQSPHDKRLAVIQSFEASKKKVDPLTHRQSHSLERRRHVHVPQTTDERNAPREDADNNSYLQASDNQQLMKSGGNVSCRYTCPYCGRLFSASNNLRGHLVLHTGVKEFTCRLCSKQFAYKHRLKKHFEKCMTLHWHRWEIFDKMSMFKQNAQFGHHHRLVLYVCEIKMLLTVQYLCTKDLAVLLIYIYRKANQNHKI